MANINDFHVTKVMPKARMMAILEIEGVCPVCKSKKTEYNKKETPQTMSFQNRYRCNDCSSEWVGNTYSSTTFNKI